MRKRPFFEERGTENPHKLSFDWKPRPAEFLLLAAVAAVRRVAPAARVGSRSLAVARLRRVAAVAEVSDRTLYIMRESMKRSRCLGFKTFGGSL